MGGKKNAGQRAATAANQLTQQGIDRLNPFLEAGAGQLPALEQGATIGGLDERLGDIFNSDTFGNLVDQRQRDVQGALSAGGLTRSGGGVQAIADVGSELGLQLENLLTGRSSNLANQGLNAGGSVANMFNQQGQNLSSGIITDAQSRANFGSQLAGLAGGIFFSDERLKENIEELGHIGDMTLCEWDWIPQTKGTVIAGCPNVGFIAQEVQAKHPDFVREESGWLMVDYEGLLGKLQADLDARIDGMVH